MKPHGKVSRCNVPGPALVWSSQRLMNSMFRSCASGGLPGGGSGKVLCCTCKGGAKGLHVLAHPGGRKDCFGLERELKISQKSLTDWRQMIFCHMDEEKKYIPEEENSDSLVAI